jgi:hypothetical protein
MSPQSASSCSRVLFLRSTAYQCYSTPWVAYNVVRDVEETGLAANHLGMNFEAFEVRVWEDVEPAFRKIIDHHLAAVKPVIAAVHESLVGQNGLSLQATALLSEPATHGASQWRFATQTHRKIFRSD